MKPTAWLPVEPAAAVITGGAGGLGLCLAHALAAEGFRAVILDRNVDALDDTYPAFETDVTDRASVERALQATADDIAPPLVLINAAGIAESAPLLPPDDALWERTQAVNVTGAWIASTACLPHMHDAGAGFICNIASTAALQGYRYTAAYVASKHALLGLTRAMACDLEGTEVRVCAVCPGFLDTPMTSRTVANMAAKTGMTEDEARAALAGMNRSKRLIAPAEVAEAIMDLLASHDAAGEALPLD